MAPRLVETSYETLVHVDTAVMSLWLQILTLPGARGYRAPGWIKHDQDSADRR
jgi:hypothetical protein